ncbi:MAG: FAD:protein FMN transferase [Oscillospiraceae bacterium]|nr:FAD:protein FMN transferase [Oscillospiraceae bacterium]
MRHNTKRILSLALAVVLTLSLFTGCSAQPKYQKFNGTIWDSFDTIISIVSYNETQSQFDDFMKTAQERYQHYHKLFDIYNSYPDMVNAKTINDNAGIAPVQVEKELFDLIKFSIEWHEKTNGKVNIAMGSVLKIWHDVRTYAEFNEPILPDMAKLEEANKHTSIDNIVLDEENMTVFISDPECSIDLGAVAKGYATELICDELSEKHQNFAISAGGNVKVNGHPQDGRKRWGIGIQNPVVDENYQMVGGNLDLAFLYGEQSLVCSGGYQRFFVYEGQRYHHLIDPVSLFPKNTYDGVTVLCEDSGVADALSTAIFMLEPQDAIDFMNTIPESECIVVMDDGNVMMTEGFKAYLESCGVTSSTPTE